MKLPKGVEIIRAKGRSYFYWNPGRGTSREGERIRLPDPDERSTDFWREIERLGREAEAPYAVGTVGHLIEKYRASKDFERLSESTKASYGVHLNRFAARDAWGLLRVRDLTAAGVLAARDALADTPGMANHMLSCGRTVWNWAIPLDYASVNPFDKVKPLQVPDRGHVPWPCWALDYVLANAPPDLARLVALGLSTCQRESDLIRMGPGHRERNGIWCRPKKTRRKRKAFLIPLQTVDALELDRWAESPMLFHASRWKAPIERHRDDLYLYSPRGAPYTETSIRARYHRWLNRTDDGRELCRRWQAWIADQVKKYEWEIDPEDEKNPTIHGLRGSGLLLRFSQGFEVAQIANDVGMSEPMVRRYMRFRDQMEVAAAGRARLKLVEKD